MVIDGAMGEGGGQVLRTSLALAAVTGQSVRIDNIRAGRQKPGLLRQHLTAVQALAAVCAAEVRGAELGSRSLSFAPGAVSAGEHHFAIGTAGSTTLVLQTVLPPLLVAKGASVIVLEGGTHNPLAPPFDFLVAAFLPLVARMGPRVEATLERPGFFPAGGGRLRVRIEPAARLQGFDLLERGEVRTRRARALVAKLPRSVGEREIQFVREALGWDASATALEEARDSAGPGNALVLEVASEHVTEVVTAFGERGVRAEDVARQAVDELRRYLATDVPVGEHLADQLLVPLAMAGTGSFRTLGLSRHATTNIDVIRRFLAVAIATTDEGGDRTRVEIRAAGAGCEQRN